MLFVTSPINCDRCDFFDAYDGSNQSQSIIPITAFTVFNKIVLTHHSLYWFLLFYSDFISIFKNLIL